MAKVIHLCPTCGKQALVASQFNMDNLMICTYQCGHSESRIGVNLADQDTLDIESLDGKRPFKYQIEGGRFLERCNGRGLLADEMGVGKTVQAAIFLKAHPECGPFAIFCKSGLRVQWNKELVRWGDFMCQIIDSPRTFWLKGVDGYIISTDSAWRFGLNKVVKGRKAVDEDSMEVSEEAKMYDEEKTIQSILKKRGVKTIVIDECQLIKNGQSKRTNAVRRCCENVEHIIALSGTPIKNNVQEYFPILNILRPDKFPSERQYLNQWADTYSNGYSQKVGGMRNPQKFLDYTKDFIIRRERKDVLADLPSIFRQFNFNDLGPEVEDAYLASLKEFNDLYDDMSVAAAAKSMNILAMLSKMRHLTGLAKINPVCDFLEEFIMSTDRKIMIFVHHKDVGETLAFKLRKMAREWPAEWGADILQLTSEMDSYQRDEVVTKFKSGNYRVLIGSTLASGEGLNLQFCSDCIMMERQWNPANEEQAEARFPRPGSTADKINAHYFVAVGTVDEFFSELVEKKRQICNSTYSGQAVQWDQTSLIKELSDVLRQKGGQKWGW